METSQSFKELFGWLWKNFLRRHWRLLGLAVGVMAIEGAMSAGLAYMMKPLFDEGFLADNAGSLGRVGMMVFAVFALRGMASVVQKTILTKVSQLSMGDIRQAMLSHLMGLDPSYHKTHGPGILIQRVEGDVGGIAKVWNALITSAGRDLVSVIALFSLALWLDWKWTLAVCLVIPLLVAPAFFLQRFVRARAREARDLAAQMSNRINEIFLGITPIKLNQLETWQAEKYRKLTRHRVRTEVRAAAGQASLPGLVDLISGLAFAAVLYFGGREIVSNSKSVGDFMAFFTAIGMMFEPLRRLGAVSGVWQVAAAAIERIKEILETQPTLRDADTPSPRPAGTPAIHLRDVTLRYGDSSVLDRLTLFAPAGKTTALVGTSGAGKSTVFNVLTRMVDPLEGQVLLEDTPVQDLMLQDLRQMISVVSQEALLFNDTLRENIVLDRDVSEQALQAALDAAHVSDFLPRLENGLDSAVGPRGSALSGGQRQRVSIARALLRDTPILLLDEATSALDTQSEAIVQQALDQLSVGRTTLVIAHRLSTIRNADKIIVMDQGRLIEEGSHEDLLARGGKYADLYHQQFRD